MTPEERKAELWGRVHATEAELARLKWENAVLDMNLAGMFWMISTTRPGYFGMIER